MLKTSRYLLVLTIVALTMACREERPNRATGMIDRSQTFPSDIDERAEDGDAAASNSPPVITGRPLLIVKVGGNYSFQPHASDRDDDTLTFDITHKPRWARFDSTTGRLSGTPAQDDLGRYENIFITVSDGQDAAKLPPFALDVVMSGELSVTLSWVPPAQNVDGSPLRDLAGYKILYGQQPGEYHTVIDIDNPGVSSYVLEGLLPGTYYITMAAYNTLNIESTLAGEARVVLR